MSAAVAWAADRDQRETTGGGWHQGISPIWLPALAAGWRATVDPIHAETAATVMLAVIDREGLGETFRPPKDPLALAHRLGGTECVGWLGVLPTLLDAPAFADAVLERIVASAGQALDQIMARPHDARNIRMTQMDVLMTAGLRLAGLPGAERWLEYGRRGLRDLLRRQFHPDGSSIEGTGWYHYIVGNMALRAWCLEREYPELELHVDPVEVAAAFDYTTAMIAPYGCFNLIGDSTHSITPFADLAAWLTHRAKVRRELGQPETPPPTLGFFPDCGQALARSGWSADADYLTMDGSARYGYHWHPARNSLQIHYRGVPLLCDPGRLRYDRTPQRLWAVTTAAHSTASYNGWDQSDTPAELQATELPGGAVFSGRYGGGYWDYDAASSQYGRGLYGQHRRTVIWLRDRYILVVDDLRHTEGAGTKPDIQLHWQFAPGSVTATDGAWQHRTDGGSAGLWLLPALYPADLTATIHCGELDPTCGWVATYADQPEPAPHLTLTLPRRDPWLTSVATLLLPHAGATPAAVPTISHAMAADHPEAQGIARLHLSWPDGSQDRIYWRPGGDQGINALHDPIDSRSIQTDAELLLCHQSAAGDPPTGVAHRASYIDGLLPQPLLRPAGTWQY